MSDHPLVERLKKLVRVLKKEEDMDTTQLQTELENALAAVQTALTAVQNAPVPPVVPVDSTWEAVKADLVTAGWTAPVESAPATPEV